MVIREGRPAWYRSLRFIQQRRRQGKDEQLSNMQVKRTAIREAVMEGHEAGPSDLKAVQWEKKEWDLHSEVRGCAAVKGQCYTSEISQAIFQVRWGETWKWLICDTGAACGDRWSNQVCFHEKDLGSVARNERGSWCVLARRDPIGCYWSSIQQEFIFTGLEIFLQIIKTHHRYHLIIFRNQTRSLTCFISTTSLCL